MSQLCNGASVEIADGSGGAYVAIANLISISFPGGTVSEVETSHLGTTVFKTFLPGLADPGQLSFEAQFSSTTYERLNDILGTSIGWKVIDPDIGTTASFSGFVANVTMNFSGVDQVSSISASVRISGSISVA